MADEDLAHVPHAVDRIADPCDSGIEIQLTAVVGDVALVIERDAQIAERLIRLEAGGPAHQLAFGERVRLDRLARKEQPPDLRQVRARVGIVAFSRPTHPERLFVDLDSLAADGPENHGADPAVPERKGLVPLRRRTSIPERHRGRRAVRSRRRLRRRRGGGEHDTTRCGEKTPADPHDPSVPIPVRAGLSVHAGPSGNLYSRRDSFLISVPYPGLTGG